MLILKIKEKGMYVQIPGTLPTHTPAEIDVSKCNLTMVDTYLRQMGIKNFEIVSDGNKKVITKPLKMGDASINQKVINQRFSKLEKMMEILLQQKTDDNSENSEQITKKLNKLETLANKLLEKEPTVIEAPTAPKRKGSVIKSRSKRRKEPQIEELDDTFIPEIDVSGMKMKGASKQIVKREEMDIDDSVDLLSRIMGNED